MVIWRQTYGKGPLSERGNPLPPHGLLFYIHRQIDRIAHTTAFVTPVVAHWLEREIHVAQWVHHHQHGYTQTRIHKIIAHWSETATSRQPCRCLGEHLFEFVTITSYLNNRSWLDRGSQINLSEADQKSHQPTRWAGKLLIHSF